MKTAIVIDNAGYLSEEEVKKLNIAKVIPISFIVNGEEYYQDVNMTYDQFYKFLEDKNTSVSTSQPSIELVKEAWREVLKDNDEIIYIPLSSGLSEACNSALNASREEEFIDRVYVANNQRVSFMNKFSIYEARCLVDEGKTAKEIKAYLEEVRGECGAYIAVDDIAYLKKGGRVTPAAAAIATILHIKPILQVHGGKLDAYGKIMSMKLAKNKLITATRKEVEDRFSEEYEQGKIVFSVIHTNPNINSPEIEKFKNEVSEQLSNMRLFSTDPLPLFVACHTGPGTLAVGYCVDRLGVMEKYCQ